MISLPDLANKLQDLGLMQKSFFQMSKPEIELLCSAVLSSFDDAVPADGWGKPRLEGNALVVPHDAHPDYHWWKPEAAKSLFDILFELDAPFEVAKNYLPRITEKDYYDKLIPF